jgi:hypothetical protein
MLNITRTSLLHLIVLYAVSDSSALPNSISIMKSNILRASQRYCALSNLGRIGCIREMIDPNEACVYGITGIDNIMKGIEGFHIKYHDVFWIFKTIKEVKDCLKVEINFDRYWTERGETNESIDVYSCSASEIIEFNDEGKICSIIYKMRPTESVLFGKEYPEERSIILTEAKSLIDCIS